MTANPAAAGTPLPEARLSDLVDRYRFSEPILVTRPTMPPLAKYQESLEEIWDSRWLTNMGTFHKKLEARLAEYLGVECLSLFCNGTIALLLALQNLRINSGEVITTPFTFPATPHVLYWNGIRPVFCDIDPETFNLDPGRVEQLIGPDTKAILAVHVYGTPCDVERLQALADLHGLYLIYDAAHAFGVTYQGRALAAFGDASMLSFHATKLFSTFEGGALIFETEAQKKRADYLRNFGITALETVIGPGINGKMNELQAAFGLLQLDRVDREIENRRALAHQYQARLEKVPGLRFLQEIPGVKRNWAYFPVLVDAGAYGMSRDDLHRALKAFNVITRKYFFPLCSTYPCYSSFSSARPSKLPVAHNVADRILCLPIYGTLSAGDTETICQVLAELHGLTRRERFGASSPW